METSLILWLICGVLSYLCVRWITGGKNIQKGTLVGALFLGPIGLLIAIGAVIVLWILGDLFRKNYKG